MFSSKLKQKNYLTAELKELLLMLRDLVPKQLLSTLFFNFLLLDISYMK